MRGEAEQESIGELFARLVEDGRELAHAELALFRTDFYRRVGRAKTAMLLCLIGAIMGQAAAVTFLVTLSFVLTPWIGRLGGAAVSVVLGVGLAYGLIRIGIGKLTAVVDDGEDDDERRPSDVVSIEMLFDRVRRKSQAARAQLTDTLGDAQARLHPQALIADLVDELTDQAQALAHQLVGTVRRRPFRLAAAALLAAMLIIRPPVGRIVEGLSRATRRGSASLKPKPAKPPARNPEETPS